MTRAAPPAPRTRNWRVMALLAALQGGSWAAYANHEHGLPVALRAGLAQALVSALGTATMTIVIEWLFSLPRRPWARVATSSVGSTVAFGSLIVGVHWFRGTPNLAKTISLPGVILPTYALLYSLSLLRAHGRAAAAVLSDEG